MTIFSAIIGVVFAFIMGVTYCASSISMQYGMAEKSTSAYIANQQIQVINDTQFNPIAFGEGAHNFEISLQYSFPYGFDLRARYSLSWSKKAGETSAPSSDNVILKFANRDNIIYDQNYIYLAASTAAGSGKITLITGVEFVNPTDENYFGRNLTITLNNNDVKVYKAQNSYSHTHPLVSGLATEDVTTGDIIYYSAATQAWLQHKKNSTATAGTTTDAYVMMYNQRRNYEQGVQFPGLNSAYKKPVVAEQYEITTGIEPDQVTTVYEKDRVYAPVWTGGNRAYAGVEMYVVAGSSDLQFEIQVEGIWRTSGNADSSYENNIQFNYTKDWTFERYSENLLSEDQGLWEVRSFNFSVQAKKARFINILDSIEITSAGQQPTEDYRIVVRSITINPSSENKTTFTYTEKNPQYVQCKKVVSNSNSSKTYYSQENISVINSTIYSNNLFNSLENAQQFYNGNITLVNNTNMDKIVEVELKLNYHISNGKTILYNDNYLRAVDLIDRDEDSPFLSDDAFKSSADYATVNSLYYSCSQESSSLSSVNQGTVQKITVKIAPYGSANVVTEYSVGASLTTEILDLFDDIATGEGKEHNRIEYYDVWTYLVPTIRDVTTTASQNHNVILETSTTETNTIVSVKNNTNSKIKGVRINNLAVRALEDAKFTQLTVEKAPNAWSSDYWKYYTKSGSDYIPVSQTEGAPDYVANKYYLKTQAYSATGIVLTMLNSFVKNSTTIENGTIELLPGESVQVASVNTTKQVVVTGRANMIGTSAFNNVEIVNNGTNGAFIVNYSNSNSYYLRMKGAAVGTNIASNIGDSTNGYYSYYIGIVRPGQIIAISTTEKLTIGSKDLIAVSGDYSETILKASAYAWHDAAVAKFNAYFNMK